MNMHYNTFIKISAQILLLYYNSIIILKNDKDKSPKNYLFFFNFELNRILNNYNKKINLYQTVDLLQLLIKNHYQIIGLFDYVANQLNMSGGFFYGEYDSVYTKILNVLDIIIDFMSIIPTNNIFQPEIIAPLQIFSMLSNLVRGDFVLAFYSFITLIPGVGNIVGAGSKIIYKLLNYIIDQIHNAKQMKRLEDLEIGKEIYRFTNYDPMINYIPESLNSIENDDILIGNQT
jgi:hypothetical protein